MRSKKFFIKYFGFCLSLLMILSITCNTVFAQDEFDILIKGGLVIGISGTEGGTYADIGVKDGKITAVGDLEGKAATKVIDAAGKTVTPGFIDIHTHSDRNIGVLNADNYISNGVTLVVGGNCGGSAAPKEDIGFGDWLAGLEGNIGINFASLIGFGNIRELGMSDPTLQPTEEELVKMKAVAAKAMEEGAVGFSTGIEYIPDRFATTEELVTIAEIVNSYGGIYATHMRNEQDQVLNAIGESIEIAAKSGIPLQISHLKACGAEVWGFGKLFVTMINMANALGVDVTADTYPWGAASTGFSQAFPSWSVQGGTEELKKRLADPVLEARIRAYMRNQLWMRIGEDVSLMQLTRFNSHPAFVGMRMSEILQELGKEPTLESAMDVIIEEYTTGGIGTIYHYLSDEDIRDIMQCSYVMISSDGGLVEFGEGTPHPRNYGSAARFLGHYIYDEYVVSPEEGIRKLTALPASRLGLTDRGYIKEGYCADIVVYDELEVSERADYFNPHQYSKGFDYVIVNGQIALDHGEIINRTCGQVVYGPAYNK